MEEIRDQLIADIEAAFRDVERGAGETLREADGEGAGTEVQLRTARAQETERTWSEIPDEVIDNHEAALSFVDPEGFRYYLPAFMRWALRHYKQSNRITVDTAIYALYPGPGFFEWNMQRFQVFNEEQSKVICRFLRFMAEYTDGRADDELAREAIEAYWGKFCDRVSR